MDNLFMKEAINQALIALNNNEVPIGAVIVHNNKIIASAYNTKETTNISTMHAEISAINEACKKLNTWRLCECDLYVTLEPCIMCFGAILESRIKRVYFGAYNKTTDSLTDILNKKIIKYHNFPEVYGGITESECEKILNDFFSQKR